MATSGSMYASEIYVGGVYRRGRNRSVVVQEWTRRFLSTNRYTDSTILTVNVVTETVCPYSFQAHRNEKKRI